MHESGSGNAKLQSLLRQQGALARFGQYALTSDNLDEILAEACGLVGAALGTELAKVMELHPNGRSVLVRAGVGWKPGVVGNVRLKVESTSSEGYALRTGHPVISPDIDAEDRFRYAAFLRDNGVRAIANVIIIGGKGRPPFGILQVDSRIPRAFDADDISFLRSYANLLAAAVDRRRNLDDLRAGKRELERRVARRTRELTAANRQLLAEAAAREASQAALRQLDNFEAVVQHLPVGAALVSLAGQVVVANAEFRRLMPSSGSPGAANPEPAPEWSAFEAEGRPIAVGEDPATLALRGELVLNREVRRLPTAGCSHRGQWRRVSGIPVRGKDGAVAAALAVIVDIDAEKRAAERQALLAREVDHRARNMLAVVSAALRLTRADDTPGFVQAIEGRIKAMARAQTLLAAAHWSGADLHRLLQGELAAFLNDGGSGPRADLRGPRVALPANAVQPFSMAIHELATNAIKYGALSSPTGRLAIEWQLDTAAGDLLRLRWAEAGGPPTREVAQPGFGSRVLVGTLRDQLGGSVAKEWRPCGLVCTIEVPLAARRASAGEGEAGEGEAGEGGARQD